MHGPFDTPPDQEAEHAPPMLRLVLDDEDAEIRAAWAAAQEADRVEARLLKLLLVSEYMETDDFLGMIDGAIEDCEERRGQLAPESESLLHLVV
jgi:hypothetical protein